MISAANVVAALDLPPAAAVDRRVSKKLLAEHGAPTAADKRRIDEAIEELRWVAALKPTTIGVPEFRDAAREYLEIAVLTADFRTARSISRLQELVHRAVPYPVLLIATQANALTVSLAHKRRSLGEPGATVLEGGMVSTAIDGVEQSAYVEGFLGALPLNSQPRTNLLAVYQGWMDAAVALRVAEITGAFKRAATPEEATKRWRALAACESLDKEIVRLRKATEAERQMARRIELNMELKRLEQERATVRTRL